MKRFKTIRYHSVFLTGFLALNLVSISARAQKVCDEVVQKASAADSDSDFMQELKKVYPSCAPWLAKACLSSFRLDKKSPMTNMLFSSKPITELTCESAETSGGVFNCFRSDEDPLGKNRNAVSAVVDGLQKASERETPTYYQAEVVRTALAKWNQVNQKRDNDLSTILSFFDQEDLSKTVSESDARNAVETLKSRVKFAAQRAGGYNKSSWQKFVADQIADAGEDTVTTWVDSNGMARRDVYPGFYSRLRQEAGDPQRFQLLVDRARSVDDGEDESFDGNLTPYHSKMILLYHLENSLKAKYKDEPQKAEKILNTLASKLHLKADFTRKGPTEWKWTIPHDGFVLGASSRQINNFRASAFSNPAYQRGAGVGVDCATFTQQVLQDAGYTQMRHVGRLTSAGISSGGQLKSIAKIETIKTDSISKINPGDLLIKRQRGDPLGHVQTVVGYEGDPPQLVVISAEGGYQRSLIRRKINIFPDQPRSCGRENHFTEDSDTWYFKASLTKGPQK